MQLLYALESIRMPWLDSVMSLITNCGGEMVFMALAIIASCRMATNTTSSTIATTSHRLRMASTDRFASMNCTSPPMARLRRSSPLTTVCCHAQCATCPSVRTSPSVPPRQPRATTATTTARNMPPTTTMPRFGDPPPVTVKIFCR